MSNPLDLEIYGYRHIQHDGDELPDRETTNFVGAGWTIADDAAGDGKTKVELSGDFGAANLITTGYIARGANPANEGAVRLTAGDAIVWNASGTPVQGLQIDGSGSVLVGDTDANEIRYDTDALGNHTFRINATPVLTLEHDLATIAQPIAIGAAPASTGAIRLTRGEAIYYDDTAGNDARVMSFDAADILWVGEGTHVEATYINSRIGTLLQVAGANELRAASGYVGFGNGVLSSAGTTRYEKTTAACFRNHGDDDDFVAWQTSDDVAGDSFVKLGGVYGTADRPKYVILDAATSNLFQIAGAPRLDIQAAYYQWGASAACSATGTHRYEDNVSKRWLSGGNDYGAVSWAGTVLTLGGALATRPTWINIDGASGVALKIGGNAVLQCQVALIAANQDFRMAAAKDLDCATNGGYLKPRWVEQAGIPAPDANEALMWSNTTLNRTEIVYNCPTNGVVSVAMA